MLALCGRLDVGEGTGDTLVGVVHGFVDGFATLGNEAIFFIPNVDRRFLERNAIDVFRLEFDDAVHACFGPQNPMKTTIS